VQKDIKGLIFLSVLNFVLLIGLSYVFMLEFGILGVGYAWIVGYGLSSLVVGMMVRKEEGVNFNGYKSTGDSNENGK